MIVISKENFELGDSILLIYDKQRRWIKLIEDKEFHTNYGFINLKDIVGVKYGGKIETNKGKWFRCLPPSLEDWIESFGHASQIIYFKDAASILLMLNVKPGDIVFEAGTGSGALTAILARFLVPGRIVTHEVREEAQKVAKKNVAKLGITNVDFHLRDVVSEGFSEGTADAVFLDLVNPWEVISKLPQSLRLAGRVVIFLPTMNQLEKTFQELLNNGFSEVSCIELLERSVQLKTNAMRPNTRMIGHTGYLMRATYVGLHKHESTSSEALEVDE